MKKFGFSKKSTFRLAIDFSEIFREGEKFSGKFVNVFFVFKDSFRVGFSVKKQKTKVRRNYCKRILKEAFRINTEIFQFVGNVHLVFFLKKVPETNVLNSLATDYFQFVKYFQKFKESG
ncbi:ribonuclease P protein component [bacterium]|nr:ribonuclease P protein component [bacterium]